MAYIDSTVIKKFGVPRGKNLKCVLKIKKISICKDILKNINLEIILFN